MKIIRKGIEREMKTLNFGVEIEMKDITRRRGAELVANLFNSHIYSVFDGYSTFAVDDSNGRQWKFVSDASVHDGQGGCEFVTPILCYDDIETVQSIVRLLRENGARIDGECGIHIHVGLGRTRAGKVINLQNLFYKFEDIIYHSCKVKRRRRAYCAKTNEGYIQRLNLDRPTSKAKFADIWYRTQNGEVGRTSHYNSTRYHAMNLHSWFTKGTVEFRLFNSTLHAGRVKAYIQFVLALVATAKRMGMIPLESKIVTDNEEDTFNHFLIDVLELTGDEFKTCRYHMLFNLKEEQIS